MEGEQTAVQPSRLKSWNLGVDLRTQVSPARSFRLNTVIHRNIAKERGQKKKKKFHKD